MGEHEIFPAGFQTRLTGYDAKCKLQNCSQLAELQSVEGLIWLAPSWSFGAPSWHSITSAGRGDRLGILPLSWLGSLGVLPSRHVEMGSGPASHSRDADAQGSQPQPDVRLQRRADVAETWLVPWFSNRWVDRNMTTLTNAGLCRNFIASD